MKRNTKFSSYLNETDIVGDMGVEELDDEAADFVNLRGEIFSCLLDISLKISHYDEIIQILLDHTNKLLANEEGLSKEKLEFKIEASLTTLQSFLKHVSPPEKFKDYQNICHQMRENFLKEEKLEIFMTPGINPIVSKAYIEIVMTIMSHFTPDSEKGDVSITLLGLFFRDTVLMSNEPEIIGAYSQIFDNFIKRRAQYFDEEVCKMITEKLMESTIRELIKGKKTYAQNSIPIFRSLAML
jgi:hypothetical protein